jgi:hypothetical protein
MSLRQPPKRTLTKQQAVRHLIHCAGRMIAAKEDPFAIQLLIQSADNLLIDITNKKKLKPVFSWDEHVKPEYKREVIRRIREISNFLKHADKDHDATLGVYEIAKLNILQLGICIINYHGLFGEWTDHMKLLFNVAAPIAPDAFAHPTVRAMMDGRFAILTTMTLAEYLAGWWSDPLLKLALPNLQTEIAEDLQDTNSLYARRISDIQLEKD